MTCSTRDLSLSYPRLCAGIVSPLITVLVIVTTKIHHTRNISPSSCSQYETLLQINTIYQLFWLNAAIAAVLQWVVIMLQYLHM